MKIRKFNRDNDEGTLLPPLYEGHDGSLVCRDMVKVPLVSINQATIDRESCNQLQDARLGGGHYALDKYGGVSVVIRVQLIA